LLSRDLRRFLRGMAYMQDNDLAGCVVNRIKDHKRVTHNRQDSRVCLIGQVSDEREFAKQRCQLLDALCDREGC
jgi:hypothetical protein